VDEFKESRIEFDEATNLDRKSGEAPPLLLPCPRGSKRVAPFRKSNGIQVIIVPTCAAANQKAAASAESDPTDPLLVIF
jgi:hypothetical protein